MHQVTVTKNATVSCFAEPAEDEVDTAQIILLEGLSRSLVPRPSHHTAFDHFTVCKIKIKKWRGKA